MIGVVYESGRGLPQEVGMAKNFTRYRGQIAPSCTSFAEILRSPLETPNYPWRKYLHHPHCDLPLTLVTIEVRSCKVCKKPGTVHEKTLRKHRRDKRSFMIAAAGHQHIGLGTECSFICLQPDREKPTNLHNYLKDPIA